MTSVAAMALLLLVLDDPVSYARAIERGRPLLRPPPPYYNRPRSYVVLPRPPTPDCRRPISYAPPPLGLGPPSPAADQEEIANQL